MKMMFVKKELQYTLIYYDYNSLMMYIGGNPYTFP